MKRKLEADRFYPIRRRRQIQTLLPGRKRRFYQTVISVVILLVVIASCLSDHVWFQAVQEQARYQLTHQTDLSPVVVYAKKILSWAVNNGITGNRTQNTVQAPAEVQLPVPGQIILGYGRYVSPADGSESFHNGIDIMTDGGTQVRAVQAGQVAAISTGDEQGQVLAIKTPGGAIMYYGYCSQVLVTEGTEVSRGQAVAVVGEAGAKVTLHFEVWIGGEPVNPESYLQSEVPELIPGDGTA